MRLHDLIVAWLAEKHPEAYVEKETVCIPIKSKHINNPKNHVWYACVIDTDHVRLFSPAKKKYGDILLAGVPTFFEDLGSVIDFYARYRT